MVRLKRQKVNVWKKRLFLPKKSSIQFKNIGRFLILVLIVGGVGFALVRVKYMFVDSEYFIVKRVEVRISDEEGAYLRTLSLTEVGKKEVVGTNILLLDLNDLEQKMEMAYPEFKEIVVRRFLPDKLIVNTTLRKGIAQIRSDRYYVIDDEGVLLPDIRNFPDPELPIITGMGINLAKVSTLKLSKFEKQKLEMALSLITQISTNENLQQYKLKVIDITDPGNITFFLAQANVEIKIGNSDFPERISVLATVLDQLGPEIGNFKYIDLRFEDPIVGPK